MVRWDIESAQCGADTKTKGQNNDSTLRLFFTDRLAALSGRDRRDIYHPQRYTIPCPKLQLVRTRSHAPGGLLMQHFNRLDGTSKRHEDGRNMWSIRVCDTLESIQDGIVFRGTANRQLATLGKLMMNGTWPDEGYGVFYDLRMARQAGRYLAVSR